MKEQIKAKWLDDSTTLSTFKCSNCGKEPMYKPCKTSKKAYVCITPYCPHCGWEMKYEED